MKTNLLIDLKLFRIWSTGFDVSVRAHAVVCGRHDGVWGRVRRRRRRHHHHRYDGCACFSTRGQQTVRKPTGKPLPHAVKYESSPAKGQNRNSARGQRPEQETGQKPESPEATHRDSEFDFLPLRLLNWRFGTQFFGGAGLESIPKANIADPIISSSSESAA